MNNAEPAWVNRRGYQTNGESDSMANNLWQINNTDQLIASLRISNVGSFKMGSAANEQCPKHEINFTYISDTATPSPLACIINWKLQFKTTSNWLTETGSLSSVLWYFAVWWYLAPQLSAIDTVRLQLGTVRLQPAVLNCHLSLWKCFWQS